MSSVLLIVTYFLVLAFLALFGIHRMVLSWWARPSRSLPAPTGCLPAPEHFPKMLVQLPLYNEKFVAERIIEAAAALTYPAEKLEIQVLDDSTDDTRGIIERKVRALAAQGVPIRVIHRPQRQGYKAGALAWGLKQSDAELVAIFDADFIPSADYLQQILVHFLDAPECGLVQARWGHLNRDASILTRAQAVFLDGHFGIEHRGRNQAGRCFNFNGTAGVWRRQAIDDAGGWRSETITEDFDLSYRAQLKGWKFKYCDDIVVPAELPQSWSAFRSQQARWTRGSIQSCRLLLREVVGASHWTFSQRLEGFIHLTSNLTYLLMAALGILLPISVVVRAQLGWRVFSGEALLSALDLTMLTAGTFAMLIFYVRALMTRPSSVASVSYWDIPIALCLGAGLSLANAREVLRGFVSMNSEFVRTPKQGETTASVSRTSYKVSGEKVILWLELAFLVYYGSTIVYAINYQLWAAIPFLLLYFVGFLFMSFGAISEGELTLFKSRWLNQARPRAEHL